MAKLRGLTRGRRSSEIRAWAFKMRGGIWTALFCAILFLAEVNLSALPAMLVLVAAGQALRFWAAGCIKRYRGEEAKAEILVTWGPYAVVRNPLYLGNGLIGLGWSLLAGPRAIALFVTSYLILYVFLIIPHEETILERCFREEFHRYKERVGRLIPKIPFELSEITGPFQWSVLWESERHSLLVTILGTSLLLSRGWW